jgi:hypothetical protein
VASTRQTGVNLTYKNNLLVYFLCLLSLTQPE